MDRTERNSAASLTYQEGVRAAANGVPYAENPYHRQNQPSLRLLWSKGHNAERARMAQRREVTQMRGQK